MQKLPLLVIACIALIFCSMSATAARGKGKHKGLSKLIVGLKGVKESAAAAKTRLAALKKREEYLVSKIEESSDEESVSEEEGNPSSTTFARAELAKVRYEKRALTKKLKTCELNKKCILAEMAIVSEVAPEPPEANEIEFERPIKGRITSNFGMRLHPIEQVEKPHQGIDMAGAVGDPVKAAANGQVTFAGTQRGYGKIVIIKHSDELSSAYGHLSEISVRVGESVAVGEKIGEVGMSGNSTGPHLHFEIRENGDPVNPTKYL